MNSTFPNKHRNIPISNLSIEQRENHWKEIAK